jgi:hypothetical protein
MIGVKTLFAAWVLVLVAGSAQAAPLDEAKAAFAQGKVAFEKGDWNTALDQFMKANQLAPAPSLSYNIGKTYEKMGRMKDAVIWFQKYLDLAGPPKDDDDRKFQDELRQRIATDQGTPERAPAPAPMPPPAGQAQPTPQPQPPQAYPYYYQQPYYAQQYPYGYNPYQPLQLTKETRLANAKRKRSSGLSSLIAGGVLAVVGAGLIGGACAITNGCAFTGNANDVGLEAGAAVMLVIGVPSVIIGPILIGVGAANFVKYSNEVKAIEREPATVGPRAMIFTLPQVIF